MEVVPKKNVSQVDQAQVPTRKIGESDRDVGTKFTDFQIICEVGRGSYGVVHRVLSLVDNKEYVMKKINMKHIKLKNQKEALKEAQILKKVRNTNIIRFYASFVEEDHLYIIMELAEGGDLAALIKQHKEKRKNFSEKQIWDFAWELCNAIDYLHNNNIIHRDIKTLNVFLSKDGHIKLGDLGVSKIVSSAASLQGTRVGTPLYLSPELVKQLPYDFKVDIWALGCVLYHLAALEPPFIGDNLITLGYNIVHKSPKPLSTSYSQKLTSFIMKFLEKNPSSRPKISDMYDQFPPKYQENQKGSSTMSTTSDPKDQIVNRIELHNLNSAKLLRVDNFESKKEDIDKALASCVSPNKNTIVTNTSARPTTAGFRGASVNQPLSEIKPNPAFENRINTHVNQSPPKVTAIIRQKAANPPSPKRATPLIVDEGNGNHSSISKREAQQGSLLEIYGLNQELKGGLFDKKQIDTESTVENKGRTVQMQMANPSGNDTTLSAKQGKESDNLKRAPKKQEQNVIIEENFIDKKSSFIQKKIPVDALKGPTPNTSMSAVQNKEVAESKKILSQNAPVIKNTNISKIDGLEKDIAVQTPPFSKAEIIQAGIMQRPESRPGSSDISMRMIMNPLIKSTSPRFKISSRFGQNQNYQFAAQKQDSIFGSNGAVRPREDLLQQKSKESKESYFGKDMADSKEDIDLSESLETREDLTKKKQISGKGNEIRIRPVSAHILKGVNNTLGQNSENNAAKSIKPAVNKVEKDVNNAVNDDAKVENAKSSENSQQLKKEPEANTKAPAVGRPKSAVFPGRLNGKGMHFNREQADAALRNLKDSEYLNNRGIKPASRENGDRRQILSGFATIENEKRLSMYDRPRARNTDITSSREDDEDGNMLDGNEKKLVSMYGGFLHANNNFMRFEFLGKTATKNSVEIIKKTDPGEDWENKIAEIKGLREPSGRPMTSTAPKKRLTIHDLKMSGLLSIKTD